MAKDYYRILSVPKDAQDDTLKKAYADIAMKWHPDKQADPSSKKAAEVIFTNAAEAYSVLSDPVKRQIYDAIGQDGLEQSGEVDPSLVFSEFFGRADDNEMTTVTDTGPKCDNVASVVRDMMVAAVKAQCVVDVSTSIGPKNVREDAPEIDLVVTLENIYRGATVVAKLTRSRFVGNNRVLDTVSLPIQLQPGVEDGTKIRLHQEGNQDAPYSRPQDLIFVVKTVPDSLYERDGSNLIMKTSVTVDEAMRGTILDITTLDGRTIHVPIALPIKEQTIRVVEGEGMPIPGTGKKGELIINCVPGW